MKRTHGFVLWFDESGNDGILKDLDGNEHYFNSYSFPKTHYRVTGICKKTGRKKTISTKFFPGLFLDHRLISDPVAKKMGSETPVSWVQASGIEQRWAVDVRLEPNMKEEVLSFLLFRALDNWVHITDSCDVEWHGHAERLLKRRLLQIDAVESNG